MEFEGDEAKRQANPKHGLDFADVARFDWPTMTIERDWRFDYGEARFIAVGQMEGRVLAVAFTLRGNVLRIVSFRPASRKERKRYGP